MRDWTARERILASLLVAAALAAVFYLFVWSPQTTRRAQLTQRLDAQQKELVRMQELSATREAKEREYTALAERIRLVEAKLPSEREIPHMIRQFQDIASSLGVKVMLLRPGPNQPGPPGAEQPPAAGAPRPRPARPGQPGQPAEAPPRYLLFPLELGFEGTYSSLMAFLARLEDFPRFVVLTRVAVKPSTLPRLGAAISANTFVLPREAQPQP